MKYYILIVYMLFISCVQSYAATLDVRISASSDDAVEEISSSDVYLDENQLDIIVYPNGDIPQKDGLRFLNISIPNGTLINSAHVQFRATQDENGQTDVTIVGENSNNPSTYTTASGDITSRTETAASVDWLNIPAWTGGQDYQTVDITPIVQEIVDLGAWQSGDDMAIMFKPYDASCDTAECNRMAVSYDGDTATAPLLHIVYGELPTPPVMGDIPNTKAAIDVPFSLDTSAYVTPTDGDPILTYTLTGTLPTGLSFDDSTGIISGTPTVLLEEQTLSLTATDKDGESTPDSFTLKVVFPLVTEYRMDECYWLDSRQDHVRDNSANLLDGTSLNSANTDKNIKVVGFSGIFDGSSDYIDVADDSKLKPTGQMSVSLWVLPTRDNTDEYYVSKRSGSSGWYLWFDNRSTDRIQFRIRIDGNWRQVKINKPSSWVNNWHFISASYDGSEIKLYVDDATATSSRSGTITTSPNSFLIGQYDDGKYFKGNIDEVKFFDVALSDSQVTDIRTNEHNGDNFDGSTRDTPTCDASTTAGGWQLIGIPAEARASKQAITFNDVFSDDSLGTYGDKNAADGWILFKPVYDPNDNLTSTNGSVALSDNVDFGTAYWLLTKEAKVWDVDGLLNVDYDVSDDVMSACTDNRCVEVDIEPAVADAGGGPNRYTMMGFIGKEPIDWANCRYVISNPDGSGEEVLTPQEAEDQGYASREIWFWTSGQGSATDGHVTSSDYSSCTDTPIGGCLLDPYSGYWIETQPASQGKRVRILLPKGDSQ